MGTLAPLAWRNVWRNPRRTVITLIVVSVGLWSVLFFNALLIGWIQSSKDAALKLLTQDGQIHAVGYMDDPSVETFMQPPSGALLDALNDGVIEDWSMRVSAPGVVQSEYKTLPITFMGVDPQAENRISTIPGDVDQGRYLQSVEDDGIILGKHLVERLKTDLGRRVIVMSQNVDGTLSEWSYDVVGIFDSDQGIEDFYIFTGLKASQEFLGLENEIAQVVVTLPDQADLVSSIQTLKDVAPELDVRSWKELNLFLAMTDDFMGVYIFVWLAIVFSMMAIGIVNTQLMAVFERTQEFGLLRALGMKPGRVLLMVSIESALLIGVGVLLGIVLAIFSIWALQGGIDLTAYARAMEMVQAGSVIYVDYHPDGIVRFSFIIWILGILVALWPARRASKCSPQEAMRRDT
ncbi:MAG: FtsX-like permease family protein [Paracoccaceae bacterium]|nr:FtsX-like permease family protein [Paracoccaceae bacterium]MDG1736524.1 FtsX-like permease family protein [Paracoccaceae bacterium]MDG2259008.1 FtsX-like permease family protein [Paracoccaceae bacterium]